MSSSAWVTTKNYRNVFDKLRIRGAYIDYWTFVHFGTGACIGFLFARMGLSFLGGVILAVIAFVFWEIVEPLLHRMIGRRFPEQVSNQIVDVLSGIVGYIIGFTLMSPNALLTLLLDVLDFLAK